MVGVAAWLAVAAIVGALIGLTVRQRDLQVPREEHESQWRDAAGSDEPQCAARRLASRRRPSIT